MPYLAIDTSNYALSVAIGDDQECLGEATTFVDRNHSNRLMPLVHALLTELKLRPTDLTGVIVGKGPGSYTGVRIGVTTAKTLAWSLQIPLAGVSSLEAMAYTARWPGFVTCPLIDARRRQVYACAIDTYAAPGKRTLVPEAIWKLDDLLEQLKVLSTPLVFVGNGAALFKDELCQVFEGRAKLGPFTSTGFARAIHLLELGSEQIRNGQTENPYTFEPEYLQLAEAEAKLRSHQKNGQNS